MPRAFNTCEVEKSVIIRGVQSDKSLARGRQETGVQLNAWDTNRNNTGKMLGRRTESKELSVRA